MSLKNLSNNELRAFGMSLRALLSCFTSLLNSRCLIAARPVNDQQVVLQNVF